MAEKDPSFLMYSKDWLQGTAKLLPEEKGVYIDLLCHQHQDGYLPKDTFRLARMVGLSEIYFLKIFANIKDKFSERDGKLFNQKLEKTINFRSEHGEMRTIIGIFGQQIKSKNLSDSDKNKVSKNFDFKLFLGKDKQTLSKAISKWISKCLSSTSELMEMEMEMEIKEELKEGSETIKRNEANGKLTLDQLKSEMLKENNV